MRSETARVSRPRSLLLREFSRNEDPVVATSRPFRSSMRRDQRLLVSGPLYTFGKDGPHITISSSRRDPPDPDKVPGPGTYDPRDGNPRRLQPEIRSSRKDQNAATLTSNIDYIDRRTFPETRQMKIGEKTNFDVFSVIDSPGPNYVPSSEVDMQRSHVIASRHIPKPPEVTPGPGAYTPKPLKRAPMIVLGPKPRYDWMEGEDTPGPGHYDPREALDRTIGASLSGHVSGRRSRANSAMAFGGGDLLAIDQIIVRLSKIGEPAETRRYAAKHPELKDIVREIFAMVLDRKPQNPLEMLREEYERIREECYDVVPRNSIEKDEYIMDIDEIVFGDEFVLKTDLTKKK